MGELRRSELSGSVGSARRESGAAHGGSVRMFSVAATSGKIGRRAHKRPFCLNRYNLPGRALACLGYAVAGQRQAVQPRAVEYGAVEYRAVQHRAAWHRAAWPEAPLVPSGACVTRSVRTGSEPYCKARIVSVRPATAVAIFPYASNPGLAMRMWWHRRPAAAGTRSVTAAPDPVAPEDRHRTASHPLCLV